MAHSWVEINLESLAWNHHIVQERLGPKAQLLAVVKANAYGHGVSGVSEELYHLGVRWFGIASVQEGQTLREILPDADILVLGCIEPDEISGLFKSNLIPTVSSIRLAQEINAVAERRRILKAVHLKIDTGMGRMGFSPGELDALLNGFLSMRYLIPEGILSHLSSADEEDLTPSRDQLHKFDLAIARMRAEKLPLRWFHLANSNAIFRLQEAHFNLVRGGLSLYGLYPSSRYAHDFGLRPVLEWKARIGLIKDFQSGQTVSYGRTYTIKQPTKIAVIPVGYADGYNRRLSNKGKVLVHGQFAPVVGRVTMDHSMVDVGHIPEAKEGDEIVLIGRQGQNQIRAEDMADWLETIPYEVVCAIGPRVERKVIGAGKLLTRTPQLPKMKLL